MVTALKARGLAGSSIRSCVSAASSMFNYAVRHAGVIPSSPVPRWQRGELPSVARETAPSYLSHDQVSLLLSALTDESRAIGALCFYGALRVSEALALTWGDIDWDGGIIHVEKPRRSPRRQAAHPTAS